MARNTACYRYVGQRLTVKADAGAVTIYERVTEVVSYPRSWRRGQTFGAERFEKVLAEQRPAVRRSQAQQRLIDSLDGLCSRELLEAYLRDLADMDRSLARQISELLELIRQYGPDIVAPAIEKASAARALERRLCRANIVRQQPVAAPATATRTAEEIRCCGISSPILYRCWLMTLSFLTLKRKTNDLPRTETATAESGSHEPSDRTEDCRSRR